MKAFIAIALFLFATCASAESYNFIEVSQGVKYGRTFMGSPNWQGDYPTRFAFGHHVDLTESWYARVEIYSHISNIDMGNGESWLDWANVTIGYKF